MKGVVWDKSYRMVKHTSHFYKGYMDKSIMPYLIHIVSSRHTYILSKRRYTWTFNKRTFLLCNTNLQIIGNKKKINGYTLVPSGYTAVAYNMGINRKRLLGKSCKHKSNNTWSP